MPADHRAQAEAAANELASSLMRGVGGQNATMQAEALDRLTRRIAPALLRFAAERMREAAADYEGFETVLGPVVNRLRRGISDALRARAAALDAARKEAQP